ncbi:Holliday junction branch migration protein RuvA [Saccharomonospora xinjiangensis]|uniref:Holliday junction branch migration protein RuvA n=1 Tax=Saccharomonospora xinjiangensis TaxID=75294 RepID=UPI00106FFEDC|nr:Holliday junction branch migration protein RuvA [Saccharomonospora xinjiangensis]QBQ60075.1 Holliday junction ATP-dependent DNA helicase RuvA [Saccharomonospora xinjiangensis]
MISSVRGEVLSVGLDHAVIEVGGVGLAVQAVPATLATLRRGTEARLHTTLVVREDALTLFGFADADSRELFGLLQTVSGIGPRLALAALAVLEPEKLRLALSDGNITMLTQVPGIGRKGAERLIIELRDKVSAPAADGDGQVESRAAGNAVRADVVEALVGLGFTAKQAEQAVERVAPDAPGDTSRMLRAALAVLGRKK